MDTTKHAHYFAENTFWKKARRYAVKAGEKVIYAALLLYFAMQRKETPLWAKTVIAGALGYFIAPLDLIPDFLLGVGYVDDFATLMSAVFAVSMFIDESVDKKAMKKMQEWFGNNYEERLEGFIAKQQ
jgi:uncharacterized membrane protein YkvA (DUF1232 family)